MEILGRTVKIIEASAPLTKWVIFEKFAYTGLPTMLGATAISELSDKPLLSAIYAIGALGISLRGFIDTRRLSRDKERQEKLIQQLIIESHQKSS